MNKRFIPNIEIKAANDAIEAGAPNREELQAQVIDLGNKLASTDWQSAQDMISQWKDAVADGSQDHIIPKDFKVATDAEVSAIMNPVVPQPSVQSKIAALEVTITARRLRESLLTEAGKQWLAAVDAQIEALRASLT